MRFRQQNIRMNLNHFFFALLVIKYKINCDAPNLYGLFYVPPAHLFAES